MRKAAHTLHKQDNIMHKVAPNSMPPGPLKNYSLHITRNECHATTTVWLHKKYRDAIKLVEVPDYWLALLEDTDELDYPVLRIRTLTRQITIDWR